MQKVYKRIKFFVIASKSTGHSRLLKSYPTISFGYFISRLFGLIWRKSRSRVSHDSHTEKWPCVANWPNCNNNDFCHFSWEYFWFRRSTCQWSYLPDFSWSLGKWRFTFNLYVLLVSSSMSIIFSIK